MSLHRSAVLVAALVVPVQVAAQGARTFFLVAGSDTIAIEQVLRSPGRLEGTLLFPSANQRWHYVATLTPREDILELQNEVWLAADTAGAPARQRARLVFQSDSIAITIEGMPAPRNYASKPGALPYLNPSFAMVEQAVRRHVVLGESAPDQPMFAVAGGQIFAMQISRAAGDSALVTVGNAPARLAVLPDGSITGGSVPSQGIRIVVVEGLAGRALRTERPDYSSPDGAPYSAQTVRVRTTMGHTLGGTLTLPREAAARVPAVVTITGSGLQDRDEAIPSVKGYRPFREVADALGRRGIAVLRLDDRGYGESEAGQGQPTSSDYADDIRAAVAFLRARSDIDPERVGLVGHSEGGLIAPLVAAGDARLKGIILMAGPAYTGRRILEFQNRYALEHAPEVPAAARDSLLREALRRIDSAAAAQPWMRFFLTYDPLATARQVKVPVLILQGATDQQVTSDQAPLLERALRESGNRDVTSRVFPETNHLFLADPDGNPAGYAALPVRTLRPEVLSAVVDWLVRRLR